MKKMNWKEFRLNLKMFCILVILVSTFSFKAKSQDIFGKDTLRGYFDGIATLTGEDGKEYTCLRKYGKFYVKEPINKVDYKIIKVSKKSKGMDKAGYMLIKEVDFPEDAKVYRTFIAEGMCGIIINFPSMQRLGTTDGLYLYLRQDDSVLKAPPKIWLQPGMVIGTTR
jgi:hypothetical protein